MRKVGVRRGRGQDRDSDAAFQRGKEKGSDGEVPVEEAKNKAGSAGIGMRRIARILNKSEMWMAIRGGETIWVGVRCAGVKPGGCNW